MSVIKKQYADSKSLFCVYHLLITNTNYCTFVKGTCGSSFERQEQVFTFSKCQVKVEDLFCLTT